MSIGSRLKAAWSALAGQSPRRRARNAAFPAADMGRLTSSWTSDPGAINRWIRYEGRTLRARSRALARGDAYGARYINACVDNIAGPNPFIPQVKAKFQNGLPNATANEAIESAWKDRCQPGNLEVTGRLSKKEWDRLVIRTVARDGEALIRKYIGGEWGMQGKLQLLDIDRLDEQLNRALPNGGSIKMGIEMDRFAKPVAYHLLREHPGEAVEWSHHNDRTAERVPAEFIRHVFVSDWPEQVRGVPWMHAAMIRLWHLGAFEEAAVINARIGASKVATIETADGEEPISLATGQDSAGNLLTDVEPGQYWALPPGAKLGGFNPTFPDQTVGPFIQACLRGAAAAVSMSYHSFANDPGAVNYSTARVALLDERDMWMALQSWYIDHVCQPDFVEWMSGAIIDGALGATYFAHRNSVRWQAKRWQWIDPQKEIDAKKTALEIRLTSRTREAAANGEDIEEIFDELADEQALADAKDIELDPVKPAQGGAMNGRPTASEAESQADA